MRVIGSALVAFTTLWMASSAFSQDTQDASTQIQFRQERHPDATEASAAETQKQPTYRYFSILNGVPMALELHHDTEVRTGKPIDVYFLLVEQQVMNSDGKREPIGFQFGNYYTAKAVDPQTAWNPNNAADCKTWNGLILSELEHHEPSQSTWPYIQFAVAQGARTIETNEDGPVWWSDDIECWGAQDRFAPF
jgi:hypothetical protein